MKAVKYPRKDEAYYARWSQRPEMLVSYEFEFKGQVVKPGMQFKVKNERTILTFTCLVHNSKLGTTWVDCLSSEGYRAVRPEKITKLVGIKRSYKKKTT